MKKIILTLLCAALALSAFAQDNTPAMLKKKELFSKAELFENPQIFSDRNANAELLKDYEANPDAYAANQLIPIITCYMSFGDLPKAKGTLEAYLKDSPKNLRAIRTMGTIYLLEKNTDKAVEYFKRGYDAGDERSAASLASAYIIANKIPEIKPYVGTLEKLAKDDLQAFNICMIYAIGDGKNIDVEMQKKLIKSLDVRKAMQSATPESFNTVLRLYMSNRDIWDCSAVSIPARAAAFVDAWPIANSAYKKALEINKNDPLALRGMGLVAYRTGDVMGAADYVQKAYDNGDKDASIDGIELFLLSGNINIWNKFKPMLADVKFTPQIRAGLVQYASRNDDAGEIFFAALDGKDTELLYKDAAVRALIEECLKKFGTDPRASAIALKVAAAKAAK